MTQSLPFRMSALCVLLLSLFIVIGCSSSDDDGDVAPAEPEVGDPIPVEPDGGIGDGAGPPLIESDDLARAIIGQSRSDAEATLNASDIPWRYVSINGENMAVTADFAPGRLNVTLENDRVSQVEIEDGPTVSADQ